MDADPAVTLSARLYSAGLLSSKTGIILQSENQQKKSFEVMGKAIRLDARTDYHASDMLIEEALKRDSSMQYLCEKLMSTYGE